MAELLPPAPANPQNASTGSGSPLVTACWTDTRCHCLLSSTHGEGAPGDPGSSSASQGVQDARRCACGQRIVLRKGQEELSPPQPVSDTPQTSDL